MTDTATPRDLARPRERANKLPILAALFLIGLVIPLSISLGPVRMSPYRIILIIAIFSCFISWISGRAGPIRGFDIMIILAYLWGMLALFVVHGVGSMIETAAILFIEGAGSYMLARATIRSYEDFQAVMRFFLLLITLLFPFALYETITGEAPILRIMGQIGSSFTVLSQHPRMGLERAQVVFDHSIPFGTFVAAGFGPAFYLLKTDGFSRIRNRATVVLSTIFSVSSGALVSLLFQGMMLGWDLVTKSIPRRWTILGLLGLLAYIVIDIISNRTPFHVLIGYLAFSASTGYGRIRIFEWGMVNIYDNPIFGIGMGDWVRAFWMGDSVDNFWLLLTMRYGVPMFILFAIAVIWVIRAVSLQKFTGPARLGQAAYLTSMGGLIVAGMTVHYWNAMFAFFMFFLGSGVWATWATEADETSNETNPPDQQPASPYMRRKNADERREKNLLQGSVKRKEPRGL